MLDLVAPSTSKGASRVFVKEVNLHLNCSFDGGVGTNLAQFNGRSARFSYLGKDRQWYEVWPPEDVPTSGNPVDDRLSDVPQWPLAIGLWVEEDGGDRTFWVESVTRTPTRTFDSDDI